MKTTFKFIITTTFTLTCICFSYSQSLTANQTKSLVRWYGEELTGKTHFGNLSFKEGQIELQDGLIIGGNFVVNMTSLSVEDLSGGAKARLEGHLRSDDFFSVDK